MQLPKNGFTFKRFFVAHDMSPMKVTTDSSLLGAWAPVTHQPKRALDIGCGCGVIALMLAQRLDNTDCVIDAVDIDPNAIAQCHENSLNSPFKPLTVQCADINQYQLGKAHHYDLIVSNPPYFDVAVECRNEQRQQARYTENLNHSQLIAIAKRLLTPQGFFCVVLPYHISARFKQLCQQHDLHLTQQMSVKYTEDKACSLSLLCFSQQKAEHVVNDTLIMRNHDNRYSQAIRDLLHDFYLFRASVL
ncbi:tRNA1Val (adenine37-N6)-methyltransferase [Orbus hercynius]|uniref:tRNA1(Val) (adenine(37)-N6)-methyltransferase n=1 Tax=Orbus hercynius TaxID=593135 RepID=A0A495RJV8_9GAMM|nr:methyltransferase [Orbus hercynius]RKS87446.1 tRNA1Val (adenine37-N6)-methyltransferase [Orbus hercynius]